MKKRLIIELKNLRAALPEEYLIKEYPVDLLLGFRVSAGSGPTGWRALAFDRRRLNYQRLMRRGAVDVIFHHFTSGVMMVSPSLSSALHWRVIYPGDAILCSHSVMTARELLAVRYEVTPPDLTWMRSILDQQTPWHTHPSSEADMGSPSAGDVEDAEDPDDLSPDI